MNVIDVMKDKSQEQGRINGRIICEGCEEGSNEGY
jgi:hypothetical protein